MAERLYRQSDIGTFLWCRRNYWFSVNRRLRPVYPSGDPVPVFANALGTLVHHGVYHASVGGTGWEEEIRTLARQLCWPEAETPPPAGGDWPKTVDWAIHMVKGWQEWVSDYGQEVGIETIAQEERLYVPMGTIQGDQVTITFKPDRIQEDHGLGGALIIDDVKTTQSLEPVQSHNRQLMTYAILYRIITGRKPQYLSTTQLKKSMRTKGGPLTDYYYRSQLYVTDEMYDTHHDELVQVLNEMVRLDQQLESGIYVGALQNPSRDCGWKCRFEAPCVTHNNGGNVEHILQTDYRKMEVETDG